MGYLDMISGFKRSICDHKKSNLIKIEGCKMRCPDCNQEFYLQEGEPDEYERFKQACEEVIDCINNIKYYNTDSLIDDESYKMIQPILEDLPTLYLKVMGRKNKKSLMGTATKDDILDNLKRQDVYISNAMCPNCGFEKINILPKIIGETIDEKDLYQCKVYCRCCGHWGYINLNNVIEWCDSLKNAPQYIQDDYEQFKKENNIKTYI